MELLHGARHSQAVAKHLRQVKLFTEPLTVFPFDSTTAEEGAKIRQDVAAKGWPIGPLDLMIAAHAIQHRLIVVTGNVREFERVEGLRF